MLNKSLSGTILTRRAAQMGAALFVIVSGQSANAAFSNLPPQFLHQTMEVHMTADATNSNQALAVGYRKNLPRSGGKSFKNLDAYLAHLKLLSVIDGDYYQSVGHGKYRLKAGHRAPIAGEKTLYTRKELLKKYGFKN